MDRLLGNAVLGRSRLRRRAVIEDIEEDGTFEDRKRFRPSKSVTAHGAETKPSVATGARHRICRALPRVGRPGTLVCGWCRTTISTIET